MSTPQFSSEEWAFLRTLLDVPEDRNTLWMYADWLEDRADRRAEFVRLLAERLEYSPADPTRAAIDAHIEQLRAELDPHWLMIFDAAPVANCVPSHAATTSFCGTLWTDLAPTDVPDIRICHRCRSAVVYCARLDDARQFANCGQRVALSTRIPIAELAHDPAFQPPPPPFDAEEEIEFDLEEFLDAEPPAGPNPPPPSPRRWWQFWT
ncbi:MAG: TIGR02996 domain-containing protein [Gemmataceae bacterium]|nr:TIGR02996 domain-containing protein [Gemmata sp.]MDW8196322.1 TIGR02996 domain-containing protein [Gemmataceae bacterium]